MAVCPTLRPCGREVVTVKTDAVDVIDIAVYETLMGAGLTTPCTAATPRFALVAIVKVVVVGVVATSHGALYDAAMETADEDVSVFVDVAGATETGDAGTMDMLDAAAIEIVDSAFITIAVGTDTGSTEMGTREAGTTMMLEKATPPIVPGHVVEAGVPPTVVGVPHAVGQVYVAVRVNVVAAAVVHTQYVAPAPVTPVMPVSVVPPAVEKSVKACPTTMLCGAVVVRVFPEISAEVR